MRILLLRHGITEANEKHLYCGSTDLPLSPAGGALPRLFNVSFPGAFYFSVLFRRARRVRRMWRS